LEGRRSSVSSFLSVPIAQPAWVRSSILRRRRSQ
jgi:hypothetical protein